ncbi:hypothetical protein BDB00DRAFT_537331 [Zychaea mexicana]|uniref:uncharacterized protein n=1 Tax=Zychaea mexicana TaxID=64656 RepID=UPI0022FE41F7|nr:uncharacterized protein BDB00DRAFT_537331 [Zychaea mexicana]KAI9490556.1 hypothetical protein BDB00DRAFT_537331 [Zychaea mexicana]
MPLIRKLPLFRLSLHQLLLRLLLPPPLLFRLPPLPLPRITVCLRHLLLQLLIDLSPKKISIVTRKICGIPFLVDIGKPYSNFTAFISMTMPICPGRMNGCMRILSWKDGRIFRAIILLVCPDMRNLSLLDV